ncbi:Aste57867_10286 [Aphanomyces stellatus]|uniref:Aste57867_10286 protein n=1 Tax=Aphanomyces stellatus TaxID=120398 RepID=A0A485KQY9_9STRA|nr:hypothetical protein As57867_010246 [Aphanomyces stellatus]VFT87160.1 Aste57867_10286 [Aphanomyces stellatus]
MVSISFAITTIAAGAVSSFVLAQSTTTNTLDAASIATFKPNMSAPISAGPLSASSVGSSMGKEDYAFLQLPATQQLMKAMGGNMSAAALPYLFKDPRLDVWTTVMAMMVQAKVDKWDQPRVDSALTLPKYQKPLTKITLLHTEIEIPTEDEDWPDDAAQDVMAATYMRENAPFVDDFTQTWKAGECKEGYVMTKVGKMWPKVHVVWNQRTSDNALKLFVFNGIGSHLVEKLPKQDKDGGTYYAVKLNFMDELEVRPGFAKYGADAFFNRHGNIIKIVRQGKTYTPLRTRTAKWEYVKMTFRGSLIAKITAIDHLMGLHMTVGNYFTTASREQLPADHPLRRLLKPFTFRAVAINRAASRSLMWSKAYLHRSLALTEAGLAQMWRYATESFKFEPFPDTIARQGVDTLPLPFHQDGLDYWNIVRIFVNDYVNLYYTSDEDVTRDASVVAFYAFLDTKIPGQLRPLTSESLKDTLAQAIFWVTAMHNHMGNIAEYVSDPAFTPAAWVEGELASRPGSAVRQAVIMALTGLTQPSVLEDFSHVMLDDQAKDVARAFTAAARDVGTKVAARNWGREQPFTTFDTHLMDISVGI